MLTRSSLSTGKGAGGSHHPVRGVRCRLVSREGIPWAMRRLEQITAVVVAAGLAQRCEVQLAYAIGVAEPVSVSVDTFGTNKISEEEISGLIRKNFEMKPGRFVKTLNLLRPIFRKTAAYGHFGRELEEFSWEKTDMADALREQAGI